MTIPSIDAVFSHFRIESKFSLEALSHITDLERVFKANNVVKINSAGKLISNGNLVAYPAVSMEFWLPGGTNLHASELTARCAPR